MNEYHVIGIMSGSSLDGLDMCYVKFQLIEDDWDYELFSSKTVQIPDFLTEDLQKADKISSLDLFKLDAEYGEWIGREVNSFIHQEKINPDLIGVHGHTVFHEPSANLSIQIGSGLIINQITNVPVVDNFRTADIVKGGQGAPLVSVGEHYLLKDYTGFVNLGGIANIAVHGEQIRAWDVAPCNQILNHFARELGYEYDRNGELAASGNYQASWFEKIAELEFFSSKPPKSLSNQWRENILNFPAPKPVDALHTYSRFLATQLSKELTAHLPESSKVLFTGGGTFNNFLMQQVKQLLGRKLEIVIPPEDLINNKEAMIFGFLGLLRMLGKINVFSSVTGAGSDSVSGSVHLGDRTKENLDFLNGR